MDSKKQNSNNTPPVKIRKDMVQRSHYRVTSLAAGGAKRIKDFQARLLNGNVQFKEIETEIAFSLVVLDGVVTKQHLQLALGNLNDIYLWNGETCLEWTCDRRTERRHLSLHTIRLLARPCMKYIQPKEILKKLEQELAELYGKPFENILDKFLHDAQANLMEVASGILFGQCINDSPITALPGSALGREAAKLALHVVKEESESRGESMGLALVFDNYFSSSNNNEGGWLISEIKSACKNNKAQQPHADKKRMLNKCLELTEKVHMTGKAASLVLAWVVDLIESGTRRKKNMSPRAISLYVSSAVEPLARTFADFSIEDANPADFFKCYQKIIDEASIGNKRTVASAISSWHYFLNYWLDAPIIYKSLYDGIPISVPKANIVWPHEMQLIHLWIDSASCDGRLMAQIEVGLTIASNARIRISELFILRMRNIRIWPDCVEIEVCPMRRDGRLKTSSSRRVLRIDDEDAAAVIKRWIEKKKEEGALSEDLIFSNPQKPGKGYKLGLTYIFMNSLLKAATGDPTVSFHTLSHSVITFRIENGLITENPADINPVDQVAADSGQASSQTPLFHYFHIYESLLRKNIDKSLSRLPLTSKAVSLLSNISGEAFRQRCARDKNKDKSEIAWNVIRECTPCLLAPGVEKLFEYSSPTAPLFLHGKIIPNYQDCLSVLLWLSEGHSAKVICARSNYSIQFIHSVALAANSLLRKLGLLGISSEAQDGSKAMAEFHMALSGEAACNIRFDRVENAKLDPLKNYFLNKHGKMLEPGLQSWRNCFRKGQVVLENLAHATGLLNMLKDAEVPSNRLVACTIYSPASNEHSERLWFSSLDNTFRTIFVTSPIIDVKKERRGRANAYLILSGVGPEHGKDIPSAASDMGGFNAVIFSACIFNDPAGPFNNNEKHEGSHE